MGVLEIMDPAKGDEKLEWDPDNPESVKKAEKLFNEKVAKGWRAFTLKTKEVQDKAVKKFNPKLGRIVLTPPMVPSPTGAERTVDLPPVPSR